MVLIFYNMNFITEFLSNNFQNCVWLVVILISMCPTLESKIAIPLAMNTAIWGNGALSSLNAFLLSFLGSIVPSIFIIILTRKLKRKTAGFVTNRFFHKYQIKSSGLENHSSALKKYLALAGFVAVPIPLTGVWTGSLIAGFSNLDIKYSFLSIVIGSFISACAITILCTVFTNSISYIFMISLIIVIAFLFVDLFCSIFKKGQHKTKKDI